MHFLTHSCIRLTFENEMLFPCSYYRKSLAEFNQLTSEWIINRKETFLMSEASRQIPVAHPAFNSVGIDSFRRGDEARI